MTSDQIQVGDSILELEEKIGVKSNFFRNLLNEDDWSFIIKLHALFEAACTHLLLFHFKEPQLAKTISRLELSNKTTGKIAFLSELELLGTEERRLISALSELRNKLVHDVRNSEFSLEKMVLNFDSNTIKNFAISYSPFETFIRKFPYDETLKLGYDDEMLKYAAVDNMITRAKQTPKLHIWVGAKHVLNNMIDMYSYSDYKNWIKSEDLLNDTNA
ncbi:hypothetical protein [uncultured Tolumonas sp.]|uniref:hypothetical protein n=1 Tax=uncultured Tolumonas sp. TaxID=263765 RepID=UPI00292EB2B1|nr:hypothetical protein [uncultured Tolumonas sp.]